MNLHISITEAAGRLGITRQAVLAAGRAGRLEATRVGRCGIVPSKAVDSYEVSAPHVRAWKRTPTGRKKAARQAAPGKASRAKNKSQK